VGGGDEREGLRQLENSNSLRNSSEERTLFLFKALQNDRRNYRYEIVYYKLKA
jgi:hypothetical protein